MLRFDTTTNSRSQMRCALDSGALLRVRSDVRRLSSALSRHSTHALANPTLGLDERHAINVNR
jgi:hypothetical protein